MRGRKEFNKRVFELFYLYNRRMATLQENFIQNLAGDRGNGIARQLPGEPFENNRNSFSEDTLPLFNDIRQKERIFFHLYSTKGSYPQHPFAVLCEKLHLKRIEQKIIICLLGIELKNSLFRECMRINRNFRESPAIVVNLIYPEPSSALCQVDILINDRFISNCLQFETDFFRGINYREFKLKPELSQWLLGLTREQPEWHSKNEREKEKKDQDLFEITEPRAGLNSVVLPPENQNQIEQAVFFHDSPEAKEIFSRFEGKQFNRSLLALFYGPPGTGKTLTASAIAGELKKPLARVEYPTIYNMWFGNSEKNVKKCFRTAAEKDMVLLFDEADALISAREGNIGIREVTNRIKNVFLQEIERFSGVVILTTNMVQILDPALERRLNLKLMFPMPGAREREMIWEKFLKKTPLSPDLDIAALAEKYEIAGGHIKNAVMTCMRELLFARTTNPHAVLSQTMLEHSAWKEMQLVEFKDKRKVVGF